MDPMKVERFVLWLVIFFTVVMKAVT